MIMYKVQWKRLFPRDVIVLDTVIAKNKLDKETGYI